MTTKIQNLSGVLFGNERLVRVFSTKQHIINGQETWTWLYFNNQSTNSSTLRPLRCGPCCTTHMYGRLLLLPASVVRSCLIYKLGKLTSPLSDFKRSFRRLPSGNSHMTSHYKSLFSRVLTSRLTILTCPQVAS